VMGDIEKGFFVSLNGSTLYAETDLGPDRDARVVTFAAENPVAIFLDPQLNVQDSLRDARLRLSQLWRYGHRPDGRTTPRSTVSFSKT
jgi:hypothetical protein